MSKVEELLRVAVVLTGSTATPDVRPTDLRDVLRRRLSDYYISIGRPTAHEDPSLEDTQLETATEALSILEQLHLSLGSQEPPSTAIDAPDPGALLGTRDLALVRTLVSIVFKWATEPLLRRITNAIPSTSISYAVAGASIIDLTGLPHEYSTLSSITSRMLAIPLADGIASPLSQSAVTATLLHRHLPDLLLPCVVIGWLPKSLASDSMPTGDALRPQAMHLLARLPAFQVISALAQTLSNAPPSLPYARKTCSFLLSRQLIRPEGIRGLCESVFVEEDMSGDDASLDKLEQVARLLSTVPTGMKVDGYCNLVVPRMLILLSVEDRALPPTHRRAIAFSLSRMLTRTDNTALQECASAIVLKLLHNPILHGAGDITIAAALRIIQVLLINTDPSPNFVSTLFTPIVSSLYALYSHLEGAKASDPVLRESLKGYLESWGRLVGSGEVISTLWTIIDGGGGTWRVDVAGEIWRSEDTEQADTPLALFTPESLKKAEEMGELDVDSNILGLKPDPAQLVRFVKTVNRVDVSSELFVKLLEGYHELRNQLDADPMRTLLYLQLVMQMQKQTSSDDTSSVLKKPEHILSFIKHALESPPRSKPLRKSRPSDVGLRMEELRVVTEECDEEGDSDDEEADNGAKQTADDMVTTSVKLLLAVLEANLELSARTAPMLNEIFSLLEPLTTVSNEKLRSLVREARMVMTARLASTSATSGNTHRRSKSSGDESESPQDTYQRALKLLQDPLLPVRAHGLLLLRQLVSAGRTPTGDLDEPELDRALIPGILSIFMQSIQDDDSYMFLNAVQGLSAMVDGYGKDVLRGLVKTYMDGVDGLGAGTMSQHDVDMRTRVGEALGQVIRRCREALPSYASILVPSLFQVIRTSHFPTILRTSAISLLAQCVKVNALAVLPYLMDLVDAMIDLLQVESVPAAQRPAASSSSATSNEHKEGNIGAEKGTPNSPPTIDSHPTSTNTRFPPLRRAALHFLGLLVQACTTRIYETGSANAFLLPPAIMKRAKTTLGYIAATDADEVVCVMAKETVEGLIQLADAVVGF